jgi:hypothetical protein
MDARINYEKPKRIKNYNEDVIFILRTIKSTIILKS